MLIINKRKMIEEKMEQLQNGYSAFAESQELIRLITREVKRRNLNVHLDHTESGCWFIPEDMK